MPGKLHVLFVRHGETQDNIDKILQGWRDTDLTENGRNDAQTVASKLKDTHIEAIYHSPLKRILQTIDPIIKDHPNVPTSADPDLRGQGMGELEGGSYSLVDMSNPRSADDKPGVEPFNDFVRRFMGSFARIVGAEAPQVGEQDRSVIMGTHGVVITSIFKALENTPNCDGFFRPMAIRGPEAYEVRYPDSTDVASLLIENPAELPIKEGVLDFDSVKGKPFIIERWGRKENEIATDYYTDDVSK